MIAGLFVQAGGVYTGLPHVDPWDKHRDARRYGGPWPVVAHPPCERWGRYAEGGPSNYGRFELGDDDGCFEAALEAVRRFGGVLEHPEGSLAWKTFELFSPPFGGGWVVADWNGGWTCCVDQGHYGHAAPKATWLYAHGFAPPPLTWGRARNATRRIEKMSKRQRAATPIPFRDLLLSLAGMVQQKGVA